ncbi:MAG: zinc-ribbon domain-containing protein [Candidatus Bathyarchaeota archaeon]|nr:zinc-ribbon domain-containing protein [Candidatus Bathyarchaeota archaeon]MDH5686363.1 zinc-ribbon domain-containing protein [Candidatus Bathyarchaeota archaeon]
MKCPNCGSEVGEGASFCANCGASLTQAIEESEEPVKLYCRNCGAELPEGAEYCSNCGASVRPVRLTLASWGERFIAWLIDS